MSCVLVTGANGFIGRNLVVRLSERGDDVVSIGSDATDGELAEAVRIAEFVFHLAGVNRPSDPAQFITGNIHATERLCAALLRAGGVAPILFASSTHAANSGTYGTSKRGAEDVLLAHAAASGTTVHLYRLPNVFGKWAKPGYNSVVATFCHNIAGGRALIVHDSETLLTLAYVDDVIDCWLALIDAPPAGGGFKEVMPVYATTVGELATTIECFAEARGTLVAPPVDTALRRALYATFLTYLPPADFAYRVPVHRDSRGDFVEFFKTPDCGQFSYFTMWPGITRGNHYHHNKAERFLVAMGTAHFGFRCIATGATHEIVVEGGSGEIVETIPGWTHNITNVGDGPLVAMLWANEVFDLTKPDTIACKV